MMMMPPKLAFSLVRLSIDRIAESISFTSTLTLTLTLTHCPTGALAGAEWDTDEQDESLPLVQGYAAAAMGRSCAIPEVGEG